jgi:hypothetical protein
VTGRRPRLGAWLKGAALASVNRLTGRHAVLLSAAARRADVHLSTHSVWDGSADPVHETLRDWWVADARFRRLLTERDLGDFVTCVAVRA